MITPKRIAEIINVVVLCLAGIVLIGLQAKPLGWYILGLGALLLMLCGKRFAKEVLLLYIALTLLGLTPITTDVSWRHIALMGTILALAVLVPLVISRRVYGDNFVRFPFHHGRKWYRNEVLYIGITIVLSYFILPWYLKSTGAYLNWDVEPNWFHLGRLFLGTNGLGIWDELFFVSTVLGILRRHIPFWWANAAQSVLFTSFLFELGFTGWGPIMIYIFAFVQGIVFKKTESLLYVITIHLSLDLVLYLAIVNAHVPSLFNIFLY